MLEPPRSAQDHLVTKDDPGHHRTCELESITKLCHLVPHQMFVSYLLD